MRANAVEDARAVFQLADCLYAKVLGHLPRQWGFMSEENKQPWVVQAALAKEAWEHDLQLWNEGKVDREPLRPKSAYFLWLEEAQKQSWKRVQDRLGEKLHDQTLHDEYELLHLL